MEALARVLIAAAVAAVLWFAVIKHPEQAGYQVHHVLVRLGQAVQAAASPRSTP